MNKRSLRIAGWAIGLSLAFGAIGTAVGASQRAPIEAGAASGDSYSFSTAANVSGSSTDGKWTFSTGKSSGSNPAYNEKTRELRLYSTSWIEITGASGIEITSASFTCKFNGGGKGSDKYPSGWSVNHGTITNYSTTLTSFSVGNINSSSFRLTMGTGDAGNCGLKTVTLTYITATPASSITLTSDSSITIGEGSTSQIVASVDDAASDKGITYSSNATAVATVNETGLITAVSQGEATITVASHSTPSVSTSVSVTVTGRVFTQNAYNKVIKQSELVAGGKYLIVFEQSLTNGYVFDGNDAAYASIAVSINSGVIAPTAQIDAGLVTISTYSTGFALNVNASNQYIGGKSGSNTIQYSDDEILNTITITDGIASIVSDTSFIQFNDASNQLRFRYFKSGTSTQQNVSLYRYVDGTLSTEGFANYLSNSTTSICSTESTSANHYSGLSAIWGRVSGKSNELSASDKSSLATAEAQPGGTPLQDALARYDHMMTRYKVSGLTDFLGRFSQGGINYGALQTMKVSPRGESSLPLIVSVIAVGLAAAGGLIFLHHRHRKED
jgi:hypothetical protein